jgi:hypothetical protein
MPFDGTAISGGRRGDSGRGHIPLVTAVIEERYQEVE